MRRAILAFCLAPIALGVVVAASRPVLAQCVNYPSYAHWDGSVETGSPIAVDISGPYAYVANDGTGLRVVDISNPEAPVDVGGVPIEDRCSGVTVSGAYAFVCTMGGDMWCTHGDLKVIDVSDPTMPSLVAGISLGSCANSVAVSGERAYVTTEANGSYGQNSLKVFDVTNPLNPSLLGAVLFPRGPSDVAVSGEYAYVAVYDSLQVIDVSNPEFPRRVVGVDLGWPPFNVVVSGSYVYASTHFRFNVIDISDPTRPTIVFSDLIAEGKLAASGDTIYVAGEHSSIIDVSEPTHPSIVGRVFHPSDVFEVALSGGIACIATGWDLEVVDITNPSSPPPIGSAITPGSAEDVAVVSGTAYVADGASGLQVIDISDPKSPFIEGSAPVPGSAAGVAVVGRTACVAWGVDYDSPGGMEVIDVSNPGNPVNRGGVSTTGTAVAVAVEGSYVYVIDDEGWPTGGHLSVVDISTSSSPTTIAMRSTSGRPRGIALSDSTTLSGRYAFIAEQELGNYPTILQVFDVSDPRDPVSVSSLTLDCCYSHGLAVSGNYVYLTGSWLYVIDVSNPSSPQVVGRCFRRGGYHGGIAIVDAHAYLAHSGVLRVFDLSDPLLPIEVGGTITNGHGVVGMESRVYVAGGSSGLQIVPIQCDAAGAPEYTRFLEAPSLRIFPNPAWRQATIRIGVPAAGPARVRILDVGGREVRSLMDGILGAGFHDLFWNGLNDAGRPVPSGVYMATIVTVDGARTVRLVSLR